MTEPPKGPKQSFVVSKTIPTGGLPDKAAKAKDDAKPTEASAADATTDAKEKPEPAKPALLAKRVMSFQVGGKVKPKP